MVLKSLGKTFPRVKGEWGEGAGRRPPASLVRRLDRRRGGVRRAGGQVEFLEAVADLIAVQAQQPAGLRLISPGELECLAEKVLLELFEVYALPGELQELAAIDQSMRLVQQIERQVL